MKLSLFPRKTKKKQEVPNVQQDVLVKLGREQFALLVRKGLAVPVALL